MATLREMIDAYSPSCQIRVGALRLLRQRGLTEAIKYLKRYSPDNDYSIFDGIETKDLNYQLQRGER